MGKGTFSQSKRQRESDKAQKKRDKAARREQQREQGPEGFEIITANEVVGNLPTTAEAMLAMEERAHAPRSAATVPCRLFVGGLSPHTTEASLREVFSKFGTVTEAVILTDRSTGQSRGFGFVTLDNRKDGARAIEHLDRYELDGRNIAVKVATKR